MRGAFSLWDDLKHYAHSYARSGRPLPLDFEARTWLDSQMARQFAHERLPEGASEFYLDELAAMVKALRQAQPAAAEAATTL